MPTTERQAGAYPDAPYWYAAETVERHSLLETGTFNYLGREDLPGGCNVVKTKVVYDVETKHDGSIDKYKCRLVAKGFSQSEGTDFEDTFAPVSQLLSMRMLLSHALAEDLTLHHLDVSTAFLASPVDPKFNIFVELPERFAGPKGERFARLNKSLYGLKQAAHDWFQLQEKFILGFDSGFVKSKSEPCMYYNKSEGRTCIVLVYVDDYLVATDNEEYFQ